jgi:N-acetylglutamate synthase-like GNAT family acetyltransferase
MPIRKATVNDIPELVQLINSAYRGESSKKGWTTEADLLEGPRTSAESLTSMLQQPGVAMLLYCNEANKMEGCVYLQQQENKLYLGMLTVAPQLQAKGIGKQLLAAAENHAHTLPCNIITMTVISIRYELVAWYERHGYQPTGKTKPFPTDPAVGLPRQPLELIVMEKPI